jgi:GIY-YIG catalytic domain
MSKNDEPLLHPARLYSALDIASRPCPVPTSPGVYAFYFNEPPPGIDTSGCHRVDQRALLYVGIAPKLPPVNGRAPSRSNLRQRLRAHYYGNAEGSTFRRTLGCLLSEQLGIKLRRVGSGGRYTFTNPGEQRLDDWMQQHAFVNWVETSAPWELEAQLLSSGLRLPLNVEGNPWLEAVAVVRAVRLKARQLADELDIVADNGGPRKRPPQISTPPSLG